MRQRGKDRLNPGTLPCGILRQVPAPSARAGPPLKQAEHMAGNLMQPAAKPLK